MLNPRVAFPALRPLGIGPALLLAVLGWGFFLLAGWSPALAQGELSYEQYRKLAWTADRMDHVTMFEPIDGQEGMFFAIADRFGTVQVSKMDAKGVTKVWKSIQLSGVPLEVITADLDGDGLGDGLLCRTNTGTVYVWSLDGYTLLWQSLPSEYRLITCFTTANLDDDMPSEIVMIADARLVYVDGVTFTKQFTSLNNYEATMIRCGDVDGDRRVEVVLNSGRVLDSRSGDIEWEPEIFYAKIELLDINGDGYPEILTEAPLDGPIRVYDGAYKSEVRFQ